METNNKLREALKLCIDEMCNRCRVNAALQGDPMPCINGCEVLRKAKAALAEPVKNCEVGTPEEQANRWYWRYHVGHLCQSCPLGPRKWSEIGAGWFCFSEWLQMPYKEGDPNAE